MVAVEMCQQDGIDRIGADAPVLQRAHGRSAAVEQKTDGTAVDVDTCLEPASTAEGVSAAEELDADIALHKGCWLMPPNGRRYWQGRRLAEKPPDDESALGTVSPKVREKPRTYPVHAVLGRFWKTVLNMNLMLP